MYYCILHNVLNYKLLEMFVRTCVVDMTKSGTDWKTDSYTDWLNCIEKICLTGVV